MGAPIKHEVELLPGQLELLASWARIILFTAGLGSGKTFGFCAWGIQSARVNHPHRVALFEPTFPMVRNILVPSLEEYCELMKLHCRWVASRRIFYVTVNGVRVALILGGASNPDHVKGPNLAGVGIDEAGQCKKGVIKQALKRTRIAAAPLLQNLLSGTPEGMEGEFYKHAEGTSDLYRRRLASGYSQRIMACSYDNPNLDEDYILEELADFDEAEAEGYIHGRFVPASGRAYPKFQPPPPGATIGGHVQPCINWHDDELVMGADFNVSPMVWLVGRRRGHRIHWFREYIQNHAFTFDLANEVALDLARSMSTPSRYVSAEDAARRVTVYCDASGQNRSTTATRTDVDHLRAAGFTVMVDASNPAVNDRAHTVNYWLKRGMMLFDPRCETTIRSFVAQGRDPKTGQPDKTKGHDHATDAVGYAAWKVFPKPRPRGNASRSQGYV